VILHNVGINEAKIPILHEIVAVWIQRQKLLFVVLVALEQNLEYIVVMVEFANWVGVKVLGSEKCNLTATP
jgi:hypothetical protein